MEEHEKDASKRIPHHKLAKEFVELVHGLGASEQAEEEHRALFRKGVSLKDITKNAEAKHEQQGSEEDSTETFINPSLNKHAQPLTRETAGPIRILLPKSLVIGQPLSRVSWAAGLVSSKAEGQRLINNGGLYIGATADGKRNMDDDLSFTPARSPSWEDLSNYVIDQKLLILRVGKWRLKIIDVVPDEEYARSGQTCPGWVSPSQEPIQGLQKQSQIQTSRR